MGTPQTSRSRTRTVTLANGAVSADTLTALNQFARALATHRDLHQTLASAVLTAAQITASPHATLLLLDLRGEQVRYRVALDNGNLAPLELVAKPMMQRGLAGWVVRERCAALVADTECDPRWLPGPGSGDLRSALVVPLLTAERVLGVLTLGHEAPNHFRPEHLRLLEIIAAQTAMALEQARLADQRQRATLAPPPDRQPASEQLATVLASELRGLGAAAASLAPASGFGEVLGTFFQAATLIVRRHAGTLIGINGDTCLAIFPSAAAPAQAAHAAYELHEATQRLRAHWQARFDLQLGLPGSGIASGNVIVGTIELAQPITHAVGSAIELAQRLCVLARGGEILASNRVAQALGDDPQFTLEALRPIHLRDQPPQSIFHITIRPPDPPSDPAAPAT